MKPMLFAGALIAWSSVAHAGLSFSQNGSATRTERAQLTGLPTFDVGSRLGLGTLTTNEGGTITFTYLGERSRILNSFELMAGGQRYSLTESDPLGTSISAHIDKAGPIDFRFAENTGAAYFAQNGGYAAPNTSIGLVGRQLNVGGTDYAFVLGYNDSAGSAHYGNWNDFVVGVNFTPASPVPEPGTYGMIITGLGILGSMVRKRRSS